MSNGQQLVLRAPADTILEDRELERFAPSIYAERPKDDVSERYGFVSTLSVLNAMRDQGFYPVEARYYNRRANEALQFTKHLITFRQGTSGKKLQVGGVEPRIMLLNSHDRSSTFKLMSGLYRLVCSNGLVVSHGVNVEPLVVRHRTDAVGSVLESAKEIAANQKRVFEHVELMKQVELSDRQIKKFAAEALSLRPTRAGAIDPMLLVNSRRKEDEGNDVWRVYNRIQENMMKGGITGLTESNRAIITREINSIDPIISINAGLWSLAMEAIDKARTSSAAQAASEMLETKPKGKKAKEDITDLEPKRARKRSAKTVDPEAVL